MKKAVITIMRTDIILTDALMIDLNVWTVYINSKQQKEDLLILSVFLSMFIIIFYYFDNHWTIIIIKVA